jgi:hypothetical protein
MPRTLRALSVGDSCVLHGLDKSGQLKFNGEDGVVEKYDFDKDRWEGLLQKFSAAPGFADHSSLRWCSYAVRVPNPKLKNGDGQIPKLYHLKRRQLLRIFSGNYRCSGCRKVTEVTEHPQITDGDWRAVTDRDWRAAP